MSDPRVTIQAAQAIGYVRGRADERAKTIIGAARKGLDVVLMPERAPLFVGRCRLCGEPARGAYCYEHEWAYGEPLA